MKQPTKKQLIERIAELDNDLVDYIRTETQEGRDKIRVKHFQLIAKVTMVRGMEDMIMAGEPTLSTRTFTHFEKGSVTCGVYDKIN